MLSSGIEIKFEPEERREKGKCKQPLCPWRANEEIKISPTWYVIAENSLRVMRFFGILNDTSGLLGHVENAVNARGSDERRGRK